MAVLTISEGAHLLSTTVSGKEQQVDVLEIISDSRQIHGLAVLYSNKYKGDVEYKQFLLDRLEDKSIHIACTIGILSLK